MALHVIASLFLKPEHAAAAEAELRSMVAKTRTEPGNRRYDLFREQDGSPNLHLYEIYDDRPPSTRTSRPAFRRIPREVGRLVHRAAGHQGAVGHRRRRVTPPYARRGSRPPGRTAPAARHAAAMTTPRGASFAPLPQYTGPGG